tara:strand:- start:1006 stop:1965 length:960 start_codon:yes stop_codon:yes gene_type:complete
MAGKTKSSSNLQVASASSKKRSKPDKEDAPPKKRGKTDAEKAEAKEAAKARAKAKKAAERESESEDAGSDAEDEEYQPDVVDENDDDVMEDIYTTGKTPEQIEDDRKKLVKTKARRRGYRTVANKGGYSALYDSGYSHLDVATAILSEGEVIRACKWAPKMTEKAAYDNLTEFEERTQLSLTSLPPSAARVIRAHGETFLRRLVNGAFQRASDQQKTGIRIAQVVAETRPLQRVLKYSFVAPKGLIRYSQDTAEGWQLKHSPEDKTEEFLREEKALLKKQKDLVSLLKKAKSKEDADKAALRAEKTAAAAAAAAKAGAS